MLVDFVSSENRPVQYCSLNHDIINENLNGHNDHQVVLFYSLPGISQPCYIFYFVHMCMTLPLQLCQISSFIMGAVLLHWTVIQSPPTYGT